MRGAVRPVRRRQIHAAAQPLRQLPRRGRAHPGPPSRRDGRYRRAPIRASCWRCGARRSAMSASSCASCPACPRWTSWPEALTLRGTGLEEARARARGDAAAAEHPDPLHALPPATFSGGEQQRVNLARGFIGGHPILLLDEPTASLDAANRDGSWVMIRGGEGARHRHRRHLSTIADVRDAIADRLFQRHSYPGCRMTETILTNARLVLADACDDGHPRHPGRADRRYRRGPVRPCRRRWTWTAIP